MGWDWVKGIFIADFFFFPFYSAEDFRLGHASSSCLSQEGFTHANILVAANDFPLIYCSGRRLLLRLAGDIILSQTRNRTHPSCDNSFHFFLQEAAGRGGGGGSGSKLLQEGPENFPRGASAPTHCPAVNTQNKGRTGSEVKASSDGI